MAKRSKGNKARKNQIKIHTENEKKSEEKTYGKYFLC